VWGKESSKFALKGRACEVGPPAGRTGRRRQSRLGRRPTRSGSMRHLGREMEL